MTQGRAPRAYKRWMKTLATLLLFPIGLPSGAGGELGARSPEFGEIDGVYAAPSPPGRLHAFQLAGGRFATAIGPHDRIEGRAHWSRPAGESSARGLLILTWFDGFQSRHARVSCAVLDGEL